MKLQRLIKRIKQEIGYHWHDFTWAIKDEREYFYRWLHRNDFFPKLQIFGCVVLGLLVIGATVYQLPLQGLLIGAVI